MASPIPLFKWIPIANRPWTVVPKLKRTRKNKVGLKETKHQVVKNLVEYQGTTREKGKTKESISDRKLSQGHRE